MKKYLTSSIGLLRIVAFLEGVSYLVLLFIAMPLKYIWGEPLAVEITGMAHGVLFLLYVSFTIYTAIELKWKFTRETWQVLLGCLIPFGAFYVEWKILAGEHKRYLMELAEVEID